MLTKTDLKWLKENLVSKSDLNNFATKQDLKNFSTKDDLKGFATKKDLIGLAKGTEIDDAKTTILDQMQKWKSEIIDKIDPVLKRVTTAEDENKVLCARDEGRQEERVALDARIKKLEDIHPNGRHTSV